VLRKQENGQPPRFLGNFLDFRVSPPQFLRRPADRQGRKALVSGNWSQNPSLSFKKSLNFTPKFLNASVSFQPQLAVWYQGYLDGIKRKRGKNQKNR
jgi:hypothetical protein